MFLRPCSFIIKTEFYVLRSYLQQLLEQFTLAAAQRTAMDRSVKQDRAAL